MKKILFSCVLVVSLFFSSGVFVNKVFAATTSSTVNWDSAASLARVNKIGSKILTDNKLPQYIVFKVSDNEEANAYANFDKEIYVYRGLLDKVQNDDELAAIIAHEIGHIANGHIARQTLVNSAIASIDPNFKNTKATTTVEVAKQLSVLKFSRNDEYEADLTGVDLMVNSGYNPLGMISVLNKICGNYFDVLATHPSGENRLMNIFDYANYNYPTIVKANYKTESYQKALSIIYSNLKVRNASPKKLRKAEKQQIKLKKAKIKRASKIKRAFNPWDTSFAVLQALSAPSGN